MPDPLAGLPPRFLRTPEAARFLGLSGRPLEKHRTYGTGPKYRKIGGRVVYAVDDLQAWPISAPRSPLPIPAPGRCCRRSGILSFRSPMPARSGADAPLETRSTDVSRSPRSPSSSSSSALCLATLRRATPKT